MRDLEKKCGLDPLPTFIHTGFAQFDHFTGGLPRGKLTVVASVRNEDRRSWMISAAKASALHQGHGVVWLTLELSREELAVRMLAAEARLPLQDLTQVHLDSSGTTQLAQASQRLAQCSLGLDTTETCSVTEIRKHCQQWVDSGTNLDLVIIDHVQLVRTLDSGCDPCNASKPDIYEITRQLKLLARDFNVAVVLLSELGDRSGVDKNQRPTLSDVREMGPTEHAADLIVVIHRANVDDSESSREEAEILIVSNRFGTTGSITLDWSSKLNLFENRDQD